MAFLFGRKKQISGGNVPSTAGYGYGNQLPMMGKKTKYGSQRIPKQRLPKQKLRSQPLGTAPTWGTQTRPKSSLKSSRGFGTTYANKSIGLFGRVKNFILSPVRRLMHHTPTTTGYGYGSRRY